MSRTEKDILIIGYPLGDVRKIVESWFSNNRFKIVESTSDSVKGRWGTGFLTAPKFIKVTFMSVEKGLIVKTEGWVTAYGLSEQDFNPSSVLSGGIPRKEGMRALQSLWTTLESLSSNTLIEEK